MSCIKFNQLTKETEMRGSESFIESNFNMIQDLLGKSIGVREMTVRVTKLNQEPISTVKSKESVTSAEITGQEYTETPSTVSQPSIQAISNEIKMNRPPLRKYIRQVGKPGHERAVVEIVEEKPKEITLASLREKFGLTESKMGGLFRDAEKFGKSRKPLLGSYGWGQD